MKKLTHKIHTFHCKKFDPDPNNTTQDPKIKSDRSNCRTTTDLNVRRVCITTLNDRNGKLLHEIWQCAKFSRKHKIKQGPQLLEVVLDRRSRQNQAVTGSKLQNGENKTKTHHQILYKQRSNHHTEYC